MRRSLSRLLAAACLFTCAAALALGGRAAAEEPPTPSLDGDLAWRSIGPFRGGRVCSVAGVPGAPNVFYFGAVGGGVWKTENAGLTWKPIFDAIGVASVGALAVAPSDPNVIYVGTGEADMRSDIGFGAGVFRSADAGKTWRAVGLAATKHIGAVLVDPRDANVVLVAALGNAYAGNPERGVFRTTNGGTTWTRTLFTNEDTGAIALALAPDDPRVVFAALWQTRRPAWNAYPPTDGPGGGLWRSDDGGIHWRRLSGGGLPAEIGRAGLTTARRGSGFRLWAQLDATNPGERGVYRSDDGGATWERVGADPRLASRGWYFSHVIADPGDPEIIWAAHVALYRSKDGGRTFEAVKGAPGGDDYHALWIDPGDRRRMILGADQGASVSLDGGATWSSWNNQPTGQFYHVATDTAFPYRVYGAQQDSGTASVSSRGRYGQITLRDWEPVGAEESGMIAPDPRDPDVVYGGGPGGSVFRFSRTTAQSEDVSPWPLPTWGLDVAEERFRFTWTSPLVFSPHDPVALYLGAQKLLRTRDRGKTWEEASPDLTLVPGASGADPGSGRGVIYAIAPSPVKRGRIWVGTDNGRIQLTDDDGKTWRDVTPPALTPWSKIGILEASAHDPATSYAAVDRHRLDDYAPHVYRTRDSGRTWTEIVRGMSAPSFVNAVREDPVRKGLLYAATETGVFVSFDGGELWRPLQANLPPTSVRDLVVHGDDLVIATHGRGCWILDAGAAPLREIAADSDGSKPRLFAPTVAVRVRGDVANDTPSPPEDSAAPNPPDGAIFDYFLPAPANEVTLEIREPNGTLRRLSSRSTSSGPVEPAAIADIWLRRPSPLPTSAGHHRIVWDLREESAPVLTPSHGIAATVWGGAPELPRGPLVLPGTYRVVLTVDGKTLERPLTVAPDPRVRVSAEDLSSQRELLHRIDAALVETTGAVRQIAAARQALAGRKDAASRARETALSRLEGSEYATTRDAGGLRRLDAELAALSNAVDRADAAPTAPQRAALAELRARLDSRLAEWKRLSAAER